MLGEASAPVSEKGVSSSPSFASFSFPPTPSPPLSLGGGWLVLTDGAAASRWDLLLVAFPPFHPCWGLHWPWGAASSVICPWRALGMWQWCATFLSPFPSEGRRGRHLRTVPAFIHFAYLGVVRDYLGYVEVIFAVIWRQTQRTISVTQPSTTKQHSLLR